ncbi:hypothetical protein MVEN_00823900 [Mycena venus]|uniref:Uncharacterized protein n=1 Tax=Mycena venus TaxID=2733690 RepID=A0A8H6YF10_9AGAR|nr:hypothetical protein MVEN_00823900 [Mycena venus]
MLQTSASSRRQVEQLRMKQEPNDHNANIAFPNARHPQQPSSLIPQPRNEMKTQSNKLRAFTMMAPMPAPIPAYDDQNPDLSQPPFDAPQYFSSPNPSSKIPEIHNYAHSGINQSQESRRSPSVSRSRSPSLQIDQDFDTADADFSQFMTKRMRETKIIKSKLAEQRLTTAALESRLSAQTTASEAAELTLKNRISELEAREASRTAKADEELRVARSQTRDAERKLEDATAKLNDIRVATRGSLDEVRNNYAALQANLRDLKSDYNVSQDAVKRLSDELVDLRRTAMDSVKGIETSEGLGRSAETRALIEELQSDRASAHQVIDMLRDKLHLLSAQVVEAKERISELEAIREGKIERVETKVEELADKLIKKDAIREGNIQRAETKVEELTSRLIKKEEEGARELANAEALEMRLHETNERLLRVSKTLEDREIELGVFREQKVAWEWELKEKCAKIASLQSLSADVVVLKEQNVTLEFQVKEIKDEKMALEYQAKEDRSKIAALQASETELIAVRAEKVAVECEVKENRSKIAMLEELQRQTSATLQRSKDQVHQHETQLVQLRAELKTVGTTKEHLQSSLETAQLSGAKLSQENSKLAQETRALTQEVNALTLREAVLKEREAVFQHRSDEFAGQLSKLNDEMSAREEELRRVNTKCSVLQERFDSQALTLKLAKEQSGDLQERLLMSESTHATKLESAVGKLNVELALLREQKANIQASLNQVTEDAATQRASFLGVSVDYENKLSKQEETHGKLIQAEERRAIAAEREAADAKQKVEDLMQQIESGRAELEDVKRKAREAASRESMGVEGEVVVLRARLEELEGENSRLQHRARTLNQRYKDGDLSDSEKSFANSLMQVSQSLHEQDIVAKENELRRRENMITSLQTKIDTLESTLARLLKERGKEGDSKSMVDLSLWMSSSPRSAEKKAAAQPAAAAASTSNRTREPSPTVFVPETPPAAAKKSSKAPKAAVGPKSSPSGHRPHKTFAAIDGEDDDSPSDSDDDTPISVTLGKRSRTPTSTTVDEQSRPTRRLRAGASRKVDPELRRVDAESSKKPADGAKSKQRKRR